MAHEVLVAGFITPSELKSYPLPVKSTQWSSIGDDQIEKVIQYASDHLEDYMDRRILVSRYVDKKWGSGGWRQMLSNYPLVELVSASSYDGNYNQTAWDVDGIFTYDSSGIIEWKNKNRYKFYKSQMWEFVYDAGYATVPGPVKHATALQTVKMLQPLFRGGTQFTEVELVSEIDEQIMELLDNYKVRRIA